MNKPNPAVIGGFVVGAVALVVIGIVAFGSTNWFRTPVRYVAYFPGSISGLQVGAPVDFRGVTIGQVVDVKVAYNPSTLEFRLPVVFEVDGSNLQLFGDEAIVARDPDVHDLIEAGLRAQLDTQSLVTGLLFVNLDVRPDTDANLISTVSDYPEIPTLPSRLAQLQEGAGRVAQSLPKLIDDARGLVKRLGSDLDGVHEDFSTIFANVAAITKDISYDRPMFRELVTNANETTADLRKAAHKLHRMLESNEEAIGTLIDEWTQTGVSSRRMADQVNDAIAENRDGVQDFTSVGLYEWTGLAQDAQDLVVRVGRVVDELERNPSRFLFGRGERGGMRPEE